MTPETRESLFEIANWNAEELYEQYGAEGLCVTKEDLPSDPDEFTQRELKQVFNPQRLEDVLDGQPATEAELHLAPATCNEQLGTRSLYAKCFQPARPVKEIGLLLLVPIPETPVQAKSVRMKRK